MPEETKIDSKNPKLLKIQYQKARHHRTVHADGAWAAVTPRLEVQFSLYSELIPTPEMTLHQVTPGGTLGEEIERLVPEGIVRESQVTIVMDLNNTAQLIRLLSNMLDQVAKVQVKQSEAQTSTKQPKSSTKQPK